ncbi:MAG: F0F1 ATP synthase subunit A [Candidatus Palauibacterales bacterium]|nr:F0F1 ATP synthase subunit A [Candidatus Palauibacterales bacterium]MDP2530326.1 F0F1 ATP synthase subunit A [Candidatus Palauibacterales bacterium]MDP2582672.1 F0F1 ATP synthase subunit A [Candidatus Palauibacterales bacterium]
MKELLNSLPRASLALAARIQETAAHAGLADTAAAASSGGSKLTTADLIHHLTNAPSIEFGPLGTLDLSGLQFPPIHVLGITIDLSVTKHVVFLFVATILTILTMWLAGRQARRPSQGETAPGGLLNVMEAFYLFLRDDVAMANIGRGGEVYVPYVVTLFFFILYANLLGLLPWGASATANISVTGALAITSLFVIEISGYRSLGPKGYLRTIFAIPQGLNPIMTGVMFIVMPPVELLSKLTRIFALAVRLFANMASGHFVILALLGLILTYGSFHAVTGYTAIVGPMALSLFVMFVEIFVAFLQAYIFATLTAVFIGLIRHAH